MDEDMARALLGALSDRVPRTKWTPAGWREVGSCRHSDPNLFYPLGRGAAAAEQAEEAKAFCRTCPSREPCLTFALSTRQDLGVWGGMAADERRRLLRSQHTSVAS
jgi:WhiB family redox-sensing transcriptional regulator